MDRSRVPKPTVMPVPREAWRKEIHMVNFINCYYQLRDLTLAPDCRSVLVIGPGQGLEVQVLRWRGYTVTTLDIDPVFHPDHVGSVHDMSMFADGQFDGVVASHVLEHLAVPYLGPALAEIARVGRHVLIYLPVHGRHAQVRVIPGVKDLDLGIIVDIRNPLERPDGVTPRYMAGQHFWEVGMRGFSVRDLLRRMAPHFECLRSYRNRDWLPSHNFVLRSKHVASGRSADAR